MSTSGLQDRHVYIESKCEDEDALRRVFLQEGYTVVDYPESSGYLHVVAFDEHQPAQLLNSFGSAGGGSRAPPPSVRLVSACSLQGIEQDGAGVVLSRVASALKGAVVCCTGLNNDMKDAVRAFITRLGGRYERNLTNHCTHLVANRRDSDKYKSAEKNNMRIVSPEWVWRCFQYGQWADEAECSLRRGALDNLVVCVTGIPLAERERVRRLVESEGGTFTADFKPAVTNFLISAPPGAPDQLTQKYRFAVEHNVPVVGTSWLDAKIKARGAHIFQEHLLDERQRRHEWAAQGSAKGSPANARGENHSSTFPPGEEKDRRRQQNVSGDDKGSAGLNAGTPLGSLPRDNPIDYDEDDDQYLEGLRVALIGLTDAALHRCKDIVLAGGGVYHAGRVPARTTHVVAMALGDITRGLSREATEASLVHPSWLEACYKQRKIARPEPYLLRRPARATPPLPAPKRPPPINLERTASFGGGEASSSSRPTPRSVVAATPRSVIATTPLGATAGAAAPAALVRSRSETGQSIVSATTGTAGGATTPREPRSGTPTGETDFSAFLNSLGEDKAGPPMLKRSLSERLRSRARTARAKSTRAAQGPSPLLVSHNRQVQRRRALVRSQSRSGFAGSSSLAGARVISPSPSPVPADGTQSDTVRAFRGLRFALDPSHPMPLEDRVTLCKRIKEQGGHIVELSPRRPAPQAERPDYIVAKQWPTGAGGLCRRDEGDDGPLRPQSVTKEWVDECLSRGELVSLHENYFRFVATPALSVPLREASFASLTITVSGIRKENRALIEALVKASGASYSEILTRKHTHLICLKPVGKKFQRAPRYGVDVVTPLWLFDSLRARAPQPASIYRLAGRASTGAIPRLGDVDHSSRPPLQPQSRRAPSRPQASRRGGASQSGERRIRPLAVSIVSSSSRSKGVTPPVATSKAAVAAAATRPSSAFSAFRKTGSTRVSPADQDGDLDRKGSIGELFEQHLDKAVQQTSPTRGDDLPGPRAGTQVVVFVSKAAKTEMNHQASAAGEHSSAESAIAQFMQLGLGRIAQNGVTADVTHIVCSVKKKRSNAWEPFLKENVRQNVAMVRPAWLFRCLEDRSVVSAGPFRVPSTHGQHPNIKRSASAGGGGSRPILGAESTSPRPRKRQKTWLELQHEDDQLLGGGGDNGNVAGDLLFNHVGGPGGDDAGETGVVDDNSDSDAVLAGTNRRATRLQERKLELERQRESKRREEREINQHLVFAFNDGWSPAEDELRFVEDIGVGRCVSPAGDADWTSWTHFITPKLNMCRPIVFAMVSQATQVIAPSFLSASARKGKLVDPGPHDWTAQSANTAAQHRIIEALRKWKLTRAFADVHAHIHKGVRHRSELEAIIRAGGGTVADALRTHQAITHCFVRDKSQLEKLSPAVVRALRKGKVACLTSDYICQYVVSGGNVNPAEYEVVLPHVPEPAAIASRKRTTRSSTKRKSQGHPTRTRRSTRRRKRVAVEVKSNVCM